MQCGSSGGSTSPSVVPEGRLVLLHKFTRQVFRHQVSGVGRTLDLDEFHCLSQVLLLEPEGAYVKVTHAAHPSALQNAQGGRRIHVDPRLEADAKVGSQ